MQDILVSIVTLTYNQETYIRQTLDSFLAQRCNFGFEIVIHDDASTDTTQSIINEYLAKYPDKIRVIKETENQYKHGLLHIYDIALRVCRGKYIAYCEGDDYFIDPEKLQKQVDFLETHEGYNLVHTGFKKYRQDKGAFSSFDSTKQDVPQGDIFDRLLVQNMITAPTTMFLKDIATEAINTLLPTSKAEKWQTPDYPLWLYMAHKGKVGYINDVTTVYRYSRASVSSNKDGEKYISFLLSVRDIKMYFLRFTDNEEVRYGALAKSACEIYQYALKKNVGNKKRYRELFKEYGSYIKGYAPLKICAKYPFFELFYR